uniref:Uncharacterized protein n=1 Tax=Graphocephala atropunctata TaxID=36148 RepID=A0A1B6LHM4_9HEMI
MALRSSEIDEMLFEESDCEGFTASEDEDNILAYSGSDDYEPPSDVESSDDDFELKPKRKKPKTSNHPAVPKSNLDKPQQLNSTTDNVFAPQATSSSSSKRNPTAGKSPVSMSNKRKPMAKNKKNPVSDAVKKSKTEKTKKVQYNDPWDTPPRIDEPAPNCSTSDLTAVATSVSEDIPSTAKQSSSVEIPTDHSDLAFNKPSTSKQHRTTKSKENLWDNKSRIVVKKVSNVNQQTKRCGSLQPNSTASLFTSSNTAISETTVITSETTRFLPLGAGISTFNDLHPVGENSSLSTSSTVSSTAGPKKLLNKTHL